MVSHAERQRRYVERQRNGLIVVDVVVHEVGITEMLLDLGFLASPDPSREELAAALSRWSFDVMTRHAAARWGPA